MILCTPLGRGRLLALVATMLLSLSLPAHSESLQDAAKLLRQGQHAQALELVEHYLAAQPKDAQARFMKGILLTEMNRPSEAIAIFQKLTEDYPELPEPYNNLAVIYAQQKQYDKAKTALEMAIRTHPSYATAHENLGDIYARLASQAYDKALQLDSSNASAQSKLAMIRELMTGNSRGAAKPAVVAKPAPVDTKPAVVAAATAKPEPPKPTAVVPATPATPVAKPAEAPKAPAPVAAAPDAAKPKKPSAAMTESTPAQAAQAWAAAWAHKDVTAYLGHYAHDFKTPGGIPRGKWEEERRGRIQKPASIEVRLEDVRVTVQGDVATVRFRQHYKAGAFKATTGKTLEMVLREGQWRIQQEKVGG